MPTDRIISFPKGVWTLLTDADVTTLRIQNLGNTLQLAATAGTSPPTGDFSFIVFANMEGDADFNLALNYPGVVGASRLWGRIGSTKPSKVSVSHA